MGVWTRFRGNERGTTAVIFSLALLPLVGMAGAAVDYSRAAKVRTDLQAAVDGTALALVRDAGRLTDAQLAAQAQKVFGSYVGGQPGLGSVSPQVTRTGRTLRVAASGNLDMTMTRVLGFRQLEIGASSEVSWGTRRIELALVLDNTGSMASRNKMRELQRASTDLLDRLEKASPERDAVRVAIVPFNTKVNVGRAALNASWLTFDPAFPSPAPRPAPADWTGCVGDRVQAGNLDMRADGHVPADPRTLHPASACGEFFNGSLSRQFLAEVQPLTSDFARLRRTVGEMRPDGCTNITIGAAWGLDALTPGGPLTGASSSPDVERIMVLLTDGNNTRSLWSQNPGHCNEGTPIGAVIDARTRGACETVKSNGVKLYTVRVIEGNAALLRDCASKGGDARPLFYDVSEASQLHGVFQQIVNEILGVRLTH